MNLRDGMRFALGLGIAGAILDGCATPPLSLSPPAPSSHLAGRTRLTNEVVLYKFSGGSDGAYPTSDLIYVNGAFYGTTEGGGSPRCLGGCGTVFRVSTTGTESVLHTFTGGSDGVHPYAALIDVDGKLYGTTFGGGAKCSNGGCGTVFRISTTGVERVLYRFRGGTDGSRPEGGLLYANGALYGTTSAGGGKCKTGGCGTVFRLSMTGTEKVLHRFDGSDGDLPLTGLIDVNGTFYGTTYTGGKGYGTVFAIAESGNVKILHNFSHGYDGDGPLGALLNVHGHLYGTTVSGGSSNEGTVYSLTTSGKENVVYSFPYYNGGALPVGALIEIGGALYGTTSFGPYDYYHGPSGGNGTVYRMTTDGVVSYLYNFLGAAYGDGANPQAGLVNVKGKLYGTTVNGGSINCYQGCGTIFSLSP